MADPTPYKRSFSFTNAQADAPDMPLAGIRLDKELDDIAERSAELTRRVNAGQKVALNQDDLEVVAANIALVTFVSENMPAVRDAVPAAAAAVEAAEQAVPAAAAAVEAAEQAVPAAGQAVAAAEQATNAAQTAVSNALDHTVNLTTNPAFFGGDVVRVPGRVFIGDSAPMTNQPAGAAGSIRSWLSEVPNPGAGGAGWLEVASKVAVTTEFGIGLMGASRTPAGAASHVSNFGSASLVWNRGIGAPLNARAWGHYIEAYNAPLAGRTVDHTHLFEYAALNTSTATVRPFNPYSSYDKGDTYGGTINSGVAPGNAGHPIRWGLRFVTVGTYNANDVQNSNGFMTGIVFRANTLLPWSDGRKRAVVMDRLDNLSWWYGTNEANAFEAFQIESAITQSSAAQKLAANDGGVTFQNAAGNPFLYVNMAAGATAPNYLSLIAVNGAAPRVASNGAGTNVDLHLAPKGQGSVVLDLANIRSYASDTAAAAGGVPIGGLYRAGNDLKIRLA